jgi:hypothetical protein
VSPDLYGCPFVSALSSACPLRMRGGIHAKVHTCVHTVSRVLSLLIDSPDDCYKKWKKTSVRKREKKQCSPLVSSRATWRSWTQCLLIRASLLPGQHATAALVVTTERRFARVCTFNSFQTHIIDRQTVERCMGTLQEVEIRFHLCSACWKAIYLSVLYHNNGRHKRTY